MREEEEGEGRRRNKKPSHNMNTGKLYSLLSSPRNVLRLTGPFSLGEAHSWVSYCLPDIPDQPSGDDVNTLHFRSTFIDTQLECTYK